MATLMFSQVYVCPQEGGRGGGYPWPGQGYPSLPPSSPGQKYPSLPQPGQGYPHPFPQAGQGYPSPSPPDRAGTVVRRDRYSSCVDGGGLSFVQCNFPLILVDLTYQIPMRLFTDDQHNLIMQLLLNMFCRRHQKVCCTINYADIMHLALKTVLNNSGISTINVIAVSNDIYKAGVALEMN